MNKEFTTKLESNKAILQGVLGLSIGLFIIIPMISSLISQRGMVLAAIVLFILFVCITSIYISSKQREVHFVIFDNGFKMRDTYGEKTIYFSQICNYNILLFGTVFRLNITGKNYYYCFSQLFSEKQIKDEKVRQKQNFKLITEHLNKKTEIIDRLLYVCFVIYFAILTLIAFYVGP